MNGWGRYPEEFACTIRARSKHAEELIDDRLVERHVVMLRIRRILKSDVIPTL